MNIAAHIAFYYVEQRLAYVEQILRNLSAIAHTIDVFVHTNRRLHLSSGSAHVSVHVIQHSLLKLPIPRSAYNVIPLPLREYLDPYLLTWRPRRYILENLEKYDVQMYLEDDIGFTNEAFEFGIRYKDICISSGYNLGFLRTENDSKTSGWFCTDLVSAPKKVIYIDNQPFLINDEFPYCAFWMYDRTELKDFTQSEEWHLRAGQRDVRERAALGWHGLDMPRYKGTVIPLEHVDGDTYVVHRDCKVHHLPNNYIGHQMFCTVPFPIRGRIIANKEAQNEADIFVVDS